MPESEKNDSIFLTLLLINSIHQFSTKKLTTGIYSCKYKQIIANILKALLGMRLLMCPSVPKCPPVQHILQYNTSFSTKNVLQYQNVLHYQHVLQYQHILQYQHVLQYKHVLQYRHTTANLAGCV